MERINREIKTAIRKYCALHPSSTWWDWLPEVLAGLRMLASRSHGYTPFHVLYKQDPYVPGRPLEVDPRFPLSFDSTLEEEGKLAEELISLFWELRVELQGRLAEAD